jgi:hypothetical protein
MAEDHAPTTVWPGEKLRALYYARGIRNSGVLV